jgi:uncharacterized lipoprotein
MTYLRAAVLIGLVVMISACGRGGSLSCTDAQRYANRDSIPPLVVPEGLVPPNQSQSLVIPPPADRAVTLDSPERPCLESPPRFEAATS